IEAQAARRAAIIAQQERLRQNAITHSKLIPEFRTGGTTMGGIAMLHPGEKILNMQQQAAVRAMAGANVFERAGVPDVSRAPVFDRGGTFSGGELPLNVTLDAQIIIGKQDQTRIVVGGISTSKGRQSLVGGFKTARRNREV